MTKLTNAARNRDIDTVKRLIAKTCDVNERDKVNILLVILINIVMNSNDYYLLLFIIIHYYSLLFIIIYNIHYY